jgi:hypothetical protein
MKKITLTCLILLGIGTGLSSQEWTKSYLDTLTGDTIRITQWQNIIKKSDLMLNFRVVKVNADMYLDLKFHLGRMDTFAVSDTNSAWIVFSDGTNIHLRNEVNDSATKGGGSIDGLGATERDIWTRYPIGQESFLILQSKFISYIRISTSRGITEAVIIPDAATSIGNAFRFMSNAPRTTKFKKISGTVIEKKPKPVVLKNNAIYLELLGNAVLFGSLNYERVVIHSRKVCFTFRTGFGYANDGTSQAMNFPLLANAWFRVSRKTCLEAGVGTLLSYSYWPEHYSFGLLSPTWVESGDSFDAAFTACFGVRIQAPSGFLFRAGFTPLVNLDTKTYLFPIFLPWGGISFGYSF